jgi:hypothetical protein
MYKPICWHCKTTALEIQPHDYARGFGDVTLTVVIPKDYCPTCGESTIYGYYMIAAERAMGFYLTTQDFDVPLKWVQRSFGWTRQELAGKLGVPVDDVYASKDAQLEAGDPLLHALRRLIYEETHFATDSGEYIPKRDLQSIYQWMLVPMITSEEQYQDAYVRIADLAERIEFYERNGVDSEMVSTLRAEYDLFIRRMTDYYNLTHP